MLKNKLTKILAAFTFGGITILLGCKELTEPILSDKQVVISAPVDNLITNSSANTFAWEPVDGATKYQFQIASPKFDSVVRFITDSSFTRNMIGFTLSPGKYQWRVRALNGSSQTNYFTRSITVQ